MSDILRVGVVGLRRGLGFVQQLASMEGAELAAVADLDQGKVADVCGQYGVARGCASLGELLDVGLDCVVIATPLSLHAEQAIEALDAGVHVLSEVTAVVSHEQAEALVAAVERSGKQYMMGENTCYWGIVEAAQHMHARGEFGTIFYGEAEYIHDLRPMMRDEQGKITWRGQRNDPIIYCTHSLGPLLKITGQYPTEVVCLGSGSHFERGVTDLQTALVRLGNGGLVRITVSFTNTHGGGHRYTLFGTQATLDTGWLRTDTPRLWTRNIPHLREAISLPLGWDKPSAPDVARNAGHGGADWHVLQAFLDSVRADTQPPIDVYEAVMWSLVGVCAAESAATGGRPVAIEQYHQRRPAT